MELDDKVFFGGLYERTCREGNRSISGRLGAARVMQIKDAYARKRPGSVKAHQRARKRRQEPLFDHPLPGIFT